MTVVEGAPLCDKACHQFYVAYKLGFALAIYHGIQSLALIGVYRESQSRSILQNSFWLAKFALLIGLSIGCFFIPHRLLSWLYYPAAVFSMVFLMIQAILLVDLAYAWAEALVQSAENGSEFAKYSLFAMTFSFNFAYIMGLIWLYVYFNENKDRILTTINAVLAVAATVCSLLPAVQNANPSAGIFQSSLLAIYSLFVVLSALVSDPTRPNTQITTSDNYPQLSKIVGVVSVFYSYLAIARGAFKVGHQAHKLVPESSKIRMEEDDEEYSYSLFHVSFILAAFYTVLFVTGWSRPAIIDNTVQLVNSTASYWMRVTSSWGVLVLYIWSLWAPVLLSEREFY